MNRSIKTFMWFLFEYFVQPCSLGNVKRNQSNETIQCNMASVQHARVCEKLYTSWIHVHVSCISEAKWEISCPTVRKKSSIIECNLDAWVNQCHVVTGSINNNSAWTEIWPQLHLTPVCCNQYKQPNVPLKATCVCKGNQFTGLMFTVKPVNEAFKKRTRCLSKAPNWYWKKHH